MIPNTTESGDTTVVYLLPHPPPREMTLIIMDEVKDDKKFYVTNRSLVINTVCISLSFYVKYQILFLYLRLDIDRVYDFNCLFRELYGYFLTLSYLLFLH